MSRRGPVFRRIPWPDQGVDDGSLSAHARAHLDDCRVKNWSPQTVDARSYRLRFFCRWAAEQGITRPADLTPAAVSAFQVAVAVWRTAAGTPLVVMVQHGYLQAVRTFCRWLTKSGRLPSNPAADLEMPRLGRQLPKPTLSVSQIEHLLAQPDLSTPHGLRDRAIMELLYSTGIRRVEVVGLRLHDLDPEARTLFVREGKGGYERMVPIGARAVAWVARYLDEVRPRCVQPGDGDWLFVTLLGEQLSVETISRVVYGSVQRAGLAKERAGSVHLFRRSCATHMLEGGADVRYVQAQLGHACLETTALYTQVTITKLKEVHAATHPAKPGTGG